MEASKIRSSFLEFFEARGHKRVPSSSLIPDDPTLLLTTAGMVQFKPYMLGLVDPPFPRAVSVQKAFRTTDIENVGVTARHMTLFEMLGNFSFGDYFKSEACAWAWELVTGEWGIDADRIWVTVFETDDEAIDIWADEVGVPRDRIVRRGKKDNFWDMGVAGPCGPCSEIYVDRGPKYGQDGGPEVDEERFLEIWNLVFMQNLCDDDINVIGDLPRKNIDTGSGLERVAIVLQDVDNAYETDLFVPLLQTAESLAGKRHGEDPKVDLSLKVLAEHGRATSFLIADGVLPSNEGRGYVLRRMLRRVVSHARRLGIERPVMERLVESTVETMGEAYPELRENRAFVLQVATGEEERFGRTLDQGLSILNGVELDRSGRIPGEVAFKLHDTFGFPIELTRELATERDLTLDEDRFASLMEEQRARGKQSVKRGEGADEGVAEAVRRTGRTEFVGYERLSDDTQVAGIVVGGRDVEVAQEGDEVRIVLPKTPFYAEGGGQIGDQGPIRTDGAVVRVLDAQNVAGDAIVHVGVVGSGELRRGDDAHAEVDAARREATARAHTATHVVHWTLKHLLGEHARQAGSWVGPGRLRFDFTHHSNVPRDELVRAEIVANEHLAGDVPVRAFETTFDEAKRLGAVALFGEKYGDHVRVVEVGDFSRELCGGTHVPHTGRVAVVTILGEQSIGSGMRRVEALVGPDAIEHVNLERRLLHEVSAALGGGDLEGAPDRARRAMERIKQLESELGKIRKGQIGELVDTIAATATDVEGVRLVRAIEDREADELRELAQLVRNRVEREGPAAVVVGSTSGGKALIAASVSQDLADRGVTAPKLLEPVKQLIGGGAGGKPTLAFAGGKDASAVAAAVQGVDAALRDLLRA
jgi:alanyl-tRNA synthetase